MPIEMKWDNVKNDKLQSSAHAGQDAPPTHYSYDQYNNLLQADDSLRFSDHQATETIQANELMISGVPLGDGDDGATDLRGLADPNELFHLDGSFVGGVFVAVGDVDGGASDWLLG